MVKITLVERRSRAARAGLREGDVLVSINDNEINDVLDYRFYLADERITIRYLRGKKERKTLIKKQQYDDIVYITNYASQCFIGKECLTRRTVDLMDALQSTDRIVAHLHFGNPYVAADAPFVPRILLGYASHECVMNALEILAGNAPALGIVPLPVVWHKKGEFLGY